MIVWYNSDCDISWQHPSRFDTVTIIMIKIIKMIKVMIAFKNVTDEHIVTQKQVHHLGNKTK
jgi:hypothetical protein